MKNIVLIENFDFSERIEAPLKAREIFSGERRHLVEVKLGANAVLAKHKAKEPITVLCLSGSGVFRAGEELEEELNLQPGTLLTLEESVPHEVTAGSEKLHLLVTKFKEN
jgi:quercetin dioxygenase-like cupin family protein